MKHFNLEKHSIRELMCYLINGGTTTIINYIVYLTLLRSGINYLAANTAAWIAAVLFAYLTNRIFVFHSDNPVGKELLSFVSLRFLTLLLENVLLAALIQLLSIDPRLSKVLVSIFTVIGNYIFCKCRIFRHSPEDSSHRQHLLQTLQGEISHE